MLIQKKNKKWYNVENRETPKKEVEKTAYDGDEKAK